MAGVNDNLQPIDSKKKARELGAKGGKASGVAKRRKKTMREAMQALLEAEVTPNVVNNLKKRGYKGEAPETYNEALQASMLVQAMIKGDTRAYGLVMDLLGEKVQQVEISSSDDKFAEVLDSWNKKKESK